MRNSNRCSKKSQNKIILSIVIPLILGGLLYYIFCPDVDFVIFIDRISNTRFHFYINKNNKVIAFFRNYFFDVLWAYSLSFAMYLCCKELKYRSFIICFLPLILGASLEILQKVKIINGTSDILDVVAELFGVIAANSIIYKMEAKNEEKN